MRRGSSSPAGSRQAAELLRHLVHTNERRLERNNDLRERERSEHHSGADRRLRRLITNENGRNGSASRASNQLGQSKRLTQASLSAGEDHVRAPSQQFQT